MTPKLDLICMGRVGVDLYAEQIGSPLKDAQTFRKYLGGCAGNIAVGSARLGLKSALFSRVGADAMGDFLKEELERNGVNTSLLVSDPHHLTALVLLGVRPPDDFPLIFYRNDCADKFLSFADINLELLANTKALLITGTCLATPNLRPVVKQVIQAAKNVSIKLILDIDFRPVLWGLTALGDGASRYRPCPEASLEFEAILPAFDLIVGTEEEFRIAGKDESLSQALSHIRSTSLATLVIKKGAYGCEIWPARESQAMSFKSFSIPVLNVLGAGDAFMSGFLKGYLEDKPYEHCARLANACGALVVSRHGCAPAMPSLPELDLFLKQPNPHSPGIVRTHHRSTIGHDIPDPLLILAFDHRQQFENSCREHHKPFDLISHFKAEIFEGFCLAACKNSSILVDHHYGKDLLDKTTSFCGFPVEQAGLTNLEWIDRLSIYQQLVGKNKKHFVKVLVHVHPDMDPAHLSSQILKLCELHEACLALERPLMLELLMPPEFESSAENLSRAMTLLYQANISPWWWKIAGQDNLPDWQKITAVLDEFDPEARLVILGQGASMAVLKQHLSVARLSPHAAGFAIGRSIFWPAWVALLKDELSLHDVKNHIAQTFKQYANLWTMAC